MGDRFCLLWVEAAQGLSPVTLHSDILRVCVNAKRVKSNQKNEMTRNGTLQGAPFGGEVKDL